MYYSQFGEDKILEQIFSKIGTSDKFFVDIGAYDGFLFSNVRHLKEEGWHGIMFDQNPRDEGIAREFFTAENVNKILQKYNIPQRFDLLSIDIDGNDYWIWKALKCKPRVLVIEFNPNLEGEEVQSYDPEYLFQHPQPTEKIGSSKKSFLALAEEKGYELCAETDWNLIFKVKEIC